MFGFITPDKGTDVGISAVKGMQNVTLRIVGSINPFSPKKFVAYRNRIRSMAETSKNVNFTEKFVNESEKAGFFSEADFILLPYLQIAQSAILADAWGFGKIPIASDIPAFREEIGNSYGMLFAAGNPRH